MSDEISAGVEAATFQAPDALQAPLAPEPVVEGFIGPIPVDPREDGDKQGSDAALSVPSEGDLDQDKEFAALPPEEQFFRVVAQSKDIITLAMAGGVYDTPEKAALAEAALSNPNNSRAVSEALRLADKYTSADAPETNAKIKKNIAQYGKFVSVEHNGEQHNLSELLDRRNVSTDRNEQDDLDDILNNGEYAPQHKVATTVAADETVEPVTPAEADKRTDQQVVDEGISAQITAIEGIIDGLKGKENEDARKKAEGLLFELKRAQKSFKGADFGGLITVGVLRASNSYLTEQGNGAALNDADMKRAGNVEVDAQEKFVRYMKAKFGVREDQSAAILEYANVGNTTELLKTVSGFWNKDLAQKFTGKEFKDQDEAEEYIGNLLTPEQKAAMMKKWGKRMGLMAIFLLIGGNGLAKITTETAVG